MYVIIYTVIEMNKKRLMGGILAAVGLVLMLTGIADEQHREVFEKAVRICLECIGIG